MLLSFSQILNNVIFFMQNKLELVVSYYKSSEPKCNLFFIILDDLST